MGLVEIVEDAGALMDAHDESYAMLVTENIGYSASKRCRPMSTTEHITRDLQARTSMLFEWLQ
jgi:hypothetical protein